MQKGEHLEPNYVQNFHPFGRLPVLDDDGIRLFESRAICEYLVAKYGAHSPLQRRTEQNFAELAIYEQAASVEYSYFDPTMKSLAYEKLFKRFMGHGDPDKATVERLEADLVKVLEHYEKVLSQRDYLAGNQFSLVDIYNIPWFQFLPNLELQDEITKRPSLRAWWKRVSNRSTWKDLTAHIIKAVQVFNVLEIVFKSQRDILRRHAIKHESPEPLMGTIPDHVTQDLDFSDTAIVAAPGESNKSLAIPADGGLGETQIATMVTGQPKEVDTTGQVDSYVGFLDSADSIEGWDLDAPDQMDLSGIGFSDSDLQLLDTFISGLPSGLYSSLQNISDLGKGPEPRAPSADKSNVEPTHDFILQDHCSRSLEPDKQCKHRLASARLTSASRNRILTALVQWGSKEISRIIEVLPPVASLDALLRFYLNTPVAHARTFIHVGTFNPNDKRADLLLAMLASSCSLSSDTTLNKLGQVFQECVLASLPKHFEPGNSTTHDLELAQAFLITLEVGAWSGHMRTAKAAESFFQPLLTMIRRTGMLNYSSYTRNPSPDRSGRSLQDEWLEWLHFESWKRLVCRIYKHDTNSSIALQVNPLISYAEFCLPLPASKCMWTATSAAEWESLFVIQQQINSPKQVTLNDYMDDADQMYLSDSTTDLGIAREVFLSFAWGLSWEYIQLVRFQSQGPRKWDPSIMGLRYDELSKILSLGHRPTNPDTFGLITSELKLNCIKMHLHVSIHDVQAFFETSEPLHTRHAYPRLVQWAKTESARKAVYFAAQLIQLVHLSAERTIRGPVAIMIYQAALVLITYGVVCRPVFNHHLQKIVQVGVTPPSFPNWR
ncbi:zinc finger MSN2 [Fusarium phyllophilum]|uniref:Zinc finger MSN2 n=1 Tax=Fusarium phyllophilum TaxID=47803 RepID=A0A8H5IY03_9HYPO|nr:zinc finger MSN2 [Fusarium phyllophilum]